MFLGYSRLNQIKKLNLLEIAQSYGLILKQAGSSNYQTLCPFHPDKNPSLCISPKENGIWLWHCFGCGSKGTVIDFVMKMENLTFKEAYKKLGERVGPAEKIPPRPKPQVSKPQAPSLPKPKESSQPTTSAQSGLRPQELLAKVIDFYHQSFKEDSRAQEYLAKRGITDHGIYLDFKLGFANGTLKNTLPQEGPILEQLKVLGLLNEKGNECFYNCIIFPIFDEHNQPVSLYGRNIEQKLHLYLVGPHRGVFNAKVLSTTKTIFLTESIIDSLSLYQLGIKEAISLYGTNGLTPDHLSLFKKYQTSQVYLCLDNDEAGKEAVRRIGQELFSLGIKTFCITLPEGTKDANDYLLAGKTRDDFDRLVSEARPLEFRREDLFLAQPLVLPKPNSTCEVSEDEGQIIFNFNSTLPSRSYRIRGLNTQRFDQLKVNIKLAALGLSHLDSFDLYNARARGTFVSGAKKVFNLDAGLVNSDLSLIIEHLETLQTQALEASRKRRQEEKPQMTEEEINQALEFLKDPNLFERILADFKASGYVGEETNLLLGYIASVSRKLSEPLALLLVSRSASGKSTLQDAVLSFTPPEDYEKYTRLTDQALFYKEEDALKHKLLAIEEEKGVAGAGYSLRNLQSAHGLRIAATIKDPLTGKLKTEVYRVAGPTAMMITTTFSESDFETYNRFIVLTVDESLEQTKLILERQRLDDSLEGLILKKKRDKIQRLHHNAQRLLKSLEVANPYSKELTFTDSILRARREQPKYLSIIKAIALLRQYQKEVKSSASDAGPLEYIEVDLKDIEIANSITNEVFGRSLDEMSPPSRRLLVEIKRLVDKTILETHLPEDCCVISRRDIREWTDWSDYQIRTHIKELEELEYLIPIQATSGKRFTYQLVWAGQGLDGEKFILGLIDLKTLKHPDPEGVLAYPEAR